MTRDKKSLGVHGLPIYAQITNPQYPEQPGKRFEGEENGKLNPCAKRSFSPTWLG